MIFLLPLTVVFKKRSNMDNCQQTTHDDEKNIGSHSGDMRNKSGKRMCDHNYHAFFYVLASNFLSLDKYLLMKN